MSKTLAQWLEWQETLHPNEIDLGLQRVTQVLKDLLVDCFIDSVGKFPFTIITVAGTNGKGSTVALLESILFAAGYRVGSYTSPHLLRYNERIKINQTEVSDEQLCDAFARIDQARKNTSLTYFEFSTLAALDIMVQQDCQVVILEVGLGGRLDAVNCVDADIALVTTIALDHQDWLGDDIEQIALEKAGVYRQHVPSLYGDDTLPQSIAKKVKTEGLHFFQYKQQYHYQIENECWHWYAGQQCIFKQLPWPNLYGEVQLKNAANVLMILHLLRDTFPVNNTTVQHGLSQVKLAGRWQTLSQQPRVIVDVAHNVQATQALVQSLKQSMLDNAKTKIHVIVGMLNDKDVSQVLAILEPLVSSWRIIELNSPRAMPAEKIHELLLVCTDKIKHKSINVFADYSQAYRNFLQDKEFSLNNDILLVFGSFFSVTEALKMQQNSQSK